MYIDTGDMRDSVDDLKKRGRFADAEYEEAIADHIDELRSRLAAVREITVGDASQNEVYDALMELVASWPVLEES